MAQPALQFIGGQVTMDEVAAAELVKEIKPKIVIPMHYADEIISSGNAQKFKELVGNSSQVEILE